jgi:hypothetical protein
MTPLVPLLVLALVACPFAEALASSPAPGLSDAELGHLRHFVKLARQEPADWSGWEAGDQLGMEAYRYQIAFMAYALALQQYHSVPAYRELYADTQARLLQRMLEKPVWEFWEEVSKSQAWHDPDWEGPQPGWRDPVREKNIMYSGHVVHMAALHEMLYRDFRWDLPGALTFRWDDDEAFVYDLPKLMTGLHRQMTTNPWGGIECEINAVFPECNQHPILAFRLFDHTHGTELFEGRKSFLALFERAPMVDPDTHEVVAYYRVKQDDVLSNRNPRLGFPKDLLVWPLVRLGWMTFDSPSACGWTGAFMHAWEPARVKEHYAVQREHHVLPEGEGARPSRDLSPELSVGYFATLAVEVGDTETAESLLAWADASYEPAWQDGALRYPRRPEADHPTHNLTGKLIALARSNRPNGLWRLHNQPWGDADFAHPLVEGIDFPRVLVRYAAWDAPAESLRLTLLPGEQPLERTRFRVSGLDPARSWRLLREDQPVAEVDWREPAPAPGVTVASPGVVEIALPLERELRYELRALPRSP